MSGKYARKVVSQYCPDCGVLLGRNPGALVDKCHCEDGEWILKGETWAWKKI